MKLPLYLAVTLLIVTSVSCDNRNTYRELNLNSEIKHLQVNVQECDTLDFSRFYKPHSFIRLSGDLSIGEITSIRTSRKRIFLLTDDKRSSILILDRSGTLVKELEQSAGDPNSSSYLGSVQFIYYDSQSDQLEVLDRSNKKILIFDGDGNYKDSFQIPFRAISFEKQSEGVYLFNCGNELNGAIKEKLVLFERNSKKVTDSFLKVVPVKSKYLLLIDLMNFNRIDETVLFIEAFTDTVFNFSLAENSLSPEYVLNFGANQLPDSYYTNKFSNIADFLNKTRSTQYAFFLSGWFALGDYYLSSVEFAGKRVHLLIKDVKIETACYYSNFLKDSVVASTSFETLPKWVNNSEQEAIFIHQPTEIIDIEKKFGKVLLNNIPVMDGLKKTDNPVIGIYKLK